MQQQGCIELNICIQAALWFLFRKNAKSNFFDSSRQRVKLAVALGRIKSLCCCTQHVGAGISYPINAMAKSHQPFSPRKLRKNHLFRAVRCSDLENHIEGWPGRSSMQA